MIFINNNNGEASKGLFKGQAIFSVCSLLYSSSLLLLIFESYTF